MARPKKITAARRSKPKPSRESGAVVVFTRKAGEIIDPFQAQRVSAVWRCVQYLAGLVSQVPWRVYRPFASGGAKPDETHTVTWLLNRRANPELSAYKFRETSVRHILYYGNSYAEIERDGAGRPMWLWPMHPTKTSLLRTPGMKLVYEYTNPDGGKVQIPQDDVFHIANASDDGLIGIPVIWAAALSIGLSRAVEEYAGTFFGNSGMPSGVLKHPKTLSEEAAKKIEEAWARNHSGRRSQATVVLEEGMEYQAISVPPEQAQFLETRRSTVEEICRWFGVPLQKVMATTQATYRNMEQFNKEVVTDTGVPLMRQFEQEADYKLLSDNWGGLHTRMDTRELLRGDSIERSTYYKNMWSIGAFSINEIREGEGLVPVTGGDARYVPMNTGPVDEEGNIITPKEPEPAEPVEPVDEGSEDSGEKEEKGSEADPTALIEEVSKAIHALKRGPRGQRGPKGASVSAVIRNEDGSISIQMSDGSLIEEKSDAS